MRDIRKAFEQLRDRRDAAGIGNDEYITADKLRAAWSGFDLDVEEVIDFAYELGQHIFLQAAVTNAPPVEVIASAYAEGIVIGLLAGQLPVETGKL